MNIKQIITVGVAGMAMGAMALDNVEVTDVKARQRYPWNGKVDIDFKVDSTPTEPYQMQVEVYDNVGKTNLPVKSVCTEGVSVEANPCMVRTDTSRIVWDAAKDLPNGFKCTNVLVTCRDARLTPIDKLYCVVNLADGSKEYLSSIPAGGWTDVHKTTKMVFRRIEAGTFMMGSPSTEVNRQSNESYHKVTLTKPYYIAVFEMTEAQYATIMGTSSNSKLPKKLRYGEVRGHDWDKYSSCKTDYCWPDKTSVDSNSPVGRLRSLTGIASIDLPTEAQWEFAAKAQTSTGLNTGYDSRDDKMVATGRYEGNKDDKKGDASSVCATHVGCYAPNAYGLYDMLGNLREWCLDAWMDDLGATDQIDPIGNPAIIRGSLGGVKRVVKGGGYFDWQEAGLHDNPGVRTNNKKDDAILLSCRSARRNIGYSSWGSQFDGFFGTEFSFDGARLVFLED